MIRLCTSKHAIYMSNQPRCIGDSRVLDTEMDSEDSVDM